MSFIQFKNANGQVVSVTASSPLPVSGGGGGGMAPEDITATAPLAWDAETSTMSASISASDVSSGTFAAARIPTLAQSKVTSLTTDLADLDRVAAHVGDADPTSLATVAAAVDAIRDALVAAGLMAGA